MLLGAKLSVPGLARADPGRISLLARRCDRMMVISRRQVVAPKAQLLLNSWKKVHVPFTIALTAFAALHIWDAWSRAW